MKSDEQIFLVCEKHILRKIYGPKRNEEEKTYQQRTNTELRAMFNVPGYIYIIGLNQKQNMVDKVGRIYI